MMKKIRNIITRLKFDPSYSHYGRNIITKWCEKYSNTVNRSKLRVLDIGCSRGLDLLNVKNAVDPLESELFGVECHTPYIKLAEKNGIEVFDINIEYEKIPAPDNFFDIVITNQIIEHTKEIFWIFSEISRVTKPNSLVIIGVPNLASLHNRIMLAFGEQPSCIETFSAHVRGYTAPGFKRFVEQGGYFKINEIKGGGFYPFRRPINTWLSKLFPKFSVGIFFNLVRTDKPGNFINVLDNENLETPYFIGK